jgi:hypothetical protein
MLEKTMRQIITKKVKEWTNTIPNLEVVKTIEKDLIITGGCFTSFIQNETPNDFDCYFRTKETVLKVANYYADLWNEKKKLQKNNIGYETKVFVLDCDNPSQEILDYYNVKDIRESAAVMLNNFDEGRVKMIYPSDGVTGNPEEANASEELGIDVTETIQELDEIKADEILKKEKEKYFPVFISTNAITLSDGIQIVVRFYGEPKEIHDTYDFVHTKAYWDNGSKELVIPKEVYEHVVNKTLRYTGSKYPVCSIFRIRKFINRGWTINAGQLLKICMQISELDLTDIQVLEDQLIGVDSIYFMQLISQFQTQKENDPNFKLTPSYLESIIDKIF